MKLAPGAMILSTYRLERPLAVGGMGSLWVATHAGTGAQVAVKFMDTAQADPTARARFQREAQSLATIHNPHVVTVREYGVEGEMPFIVMDLLEGEDLGARLRRVGRLSLPDTSRLLTQIGRGLRAAHAAGIVHRDLKPANVFLAASDGEETVKILDFGLAKNATARAVGEGTKTGDLVGSPHFMSPEQIRSPTSIDHRSDLWSLAVILFRVLTGELPFKGKQVGPVLAQVLTDTIPKATQVAPDLPPALDPFFARALARDPAQRFQSAQEMAHDLARIAANAGYTEPSARWADPSTSGATYTSGVTSISGPLLGDSMASAPPATPASASRPGLRSGAMPGGAAPGTPQASWSGQYALPSLPSASGSGQQAMTPMPPGSFSGQPIPPLATTAAPSAPKPTPWLPWVLAAAGVAIALSMGVLVATRGPASPAVAKSAAHGETSAAASTPSASTAPPPAAPPPTAPPSAVSAAPASPAAASASAEPAPPVLSAAPSTAAPLAAPPRAPRGPGHTSEPPPRPAAGQKTPNWGF